jgi:hypothetical protein
VSELRGLVVDAKRREVMARAARAVGKPRAAFDVAHDLLALAGIATKVGPTERAVLEGPDGALRGSKSTAPQPASHAARPLPEGA